MAAEYKSFLRQTSIPDRFEEKRKEIENFVLKQKRKGNRIVLVTSGGTKVPLESKTVRFLDNFSSGTRGALSTEYFLQEGYAVIFLHRNRSMQPFTRHFSHLNFLDLLEFENEQSNAVKVKSCYESKVAENLRLHKKFKSEDVLLNLEFQTLGEYLQLLSASAEALSCHGNKAMCYLAAAVSDFYIPKEQMPEHKIQSTNGPLQLSLEMVPKMLEPLVKEWVPDAFVVSFKLETDQELLVSKAQQALKKYYHQLVIANLLETRKKVVVMVTKDSSQKIEMTDNELANGKEIEEQIVKELVRRHRSFADQ